MCFIYAYICVFVCLAAQSCPTLCDPMYRSSPGSSVHGDSPGKNTGVGCHILLHIYIYISYIDIYIYREREREREDNVLHTPSITEVFIIAIIITKYFTGVISFSFLKIPWDNTALLLSGPVYRHSHLLLC